MWRRVRWNPIGRCLAVSVRRYTSYRAVNLPFALTQPLTVFG